MQLAPSALHATAESLVSLLGPWQATDPAADGTIHLHGPFERHIGMRLVHDGRTVQLWATGGTTPTDARDDDTTNPLPTGRRWHTACHIGTLTEDQDPAVELLTTISDNLLPVFDTKPRHVGHRPWLTQNTDGIDAADVEATVQAALAAGVDPADLDDEPTPQTPAPQPAPEPQPEKADRSHKLAQASWRTGARRYAEAQGATTEQARAFGQWYIDQGHASPKDAPLHDLYAQWRDTQPEAQEPEPTTKAAAKRPTRKRTPKAATA